MNSTESAETNAPPRPSVALVVFSLLVMTVCAIFAGLTAPLHIVAEYPPLIIFSCILAGGSLIVGGNQFLGTFRHWPGSALLVGLVLLFVGTLWLVLLFGIYLGSRHEQTSFWDYTAFDLSIFCGGLVIWAGTLNVLWRIQLNRAATAGSEAPPPLWQFSFREMLLLMTVLAVGLASTGYQLRKIPPKWGENVEASQARLDLPPEAEGICFSRSEDAIAVEFAMDEAGFRKWVSEDHSYDDRWQTPLQEISSTYEITRYWKSNRPPARNPVAKINRGWYLENQLPGRVLQVAYDAETGKVYLYESWEVNYDH